MAAEIITQTEDELVIQIKVPLKKSMMESEVAIQDAVNQVGTLATGEALKQHDTDGTPITLGSVKFTSRCKNGKTYQTPYGAVRIERYAYQTSKGGKIYVPLESGARIIQGSTPRFAQILSHKYSNLAAPAVIEDLRSNHQRKIASSYLQNVTDYVGCIAQAKEESWEYDIPPLNKAVATIGVSLDGAYIPTIEDGYREGMVGTIAYYDSEGERLHTTYVAAAPEYGKETFHTRFTREVTRAKTAYPTAVTVGVADGAASNWSFLTQHTSKQILDFWHATEYLAQASHGVFVPKSQSQQREEWLEQRCHDLKHKQGAAKKIINELKACTSKRMKKDIKEKLEAAITYFGNNIEAGRMKYHQHVKANLPIGSGVTEAACKVIIKQRLAGSGMRWKSNGMKIILSLRTLVKTKGRWDQFWEKINISGVPTF